MTKYARCVICKKALPFFFAEWLTKRGERSTCESALCRKKWAVKNGQLCCMKATYINCVCHRSYKCPKHGEVHVGTHD